MTQKNLYRPSNSDDNFDLDNYIEEKANSGNREQFKESKSPEQKSNWFKNALILSVFGFTTLLYFNDWSPKQVYGNIFGIEEYQAGYVAPSSSTQPVTTDLQPGAERQLVDLSRLEELSKLERLEGLESLEGLEGLEGLAEIEGLENLEASIANLESMEEMNELREFALSTAMEALAGISESDEFGNAIGEAAQLGIQEALRELEALREQELLDAENLAEQARELNQGFIDYSGELAKLGLDEKFNNSSLQKLLEANVPTSFLQNLDERGLLEKMTTDGIIKAYQEEGQ